MSQHFKYLETQEDEKIFNERGFFVRYDDLPIFIDVSYVLTKWFIILILGMYFFYLMFLQPILNIGWIYYFLIVLFIWYYGSRNYISLFLKSGRIYFSNKILISVEIKKKRDNINKIEEIFNYFCINNFFGDFILLISIFVLIFYLNSHPLFGIMGLLFITIIFPGCLFLVQYIYQGINPLYAFGNIGEKIQKLTPQIEEKNKQIQSEFQSDMNFSVLSKGFNSLSSTFSKIVSLVIKLEKVEARANKGNLFDSEKYINSLRSDIVSPLQSLREFLETKKTELMNSQGELNRVRVGGGKESRNIELQSKISESLIQELTENIEKLDEMIAKI